MVGSDLSRCWWVQDCKPLQECYGWFVLKMSFLPSTPHPVAPPLYNPKATKKKKKEKKEKARFCVLHGSYCSSLGQICDEYSSLISSTSYSHSRTSVYSFGFRHLQIYFLLKDTFPITISWDCMRSCASCLWSMLSSAYWELALGWSLAPSPSAAWLQEVIVLLEIMNSDW